MKKLGRLPQKKDKRTLQFSDYILKASIPPIACVWKSVPPMGQLLNDQIGDCTIAAILHNERIWSNAIGANYTPTDSQALRGYEAVGGYVPGNPNTDNGCTCIDVLNYAQNKGIGGRKIGPYVQVNVTNLYHVKMACHWFGGLYIGINMPVSAQNQIHGWSVPTEGATGDGAPNSWGGHCVDVNGYTPHGIEFITWGEQLPMTWDFWNAYVEECYAIISPDFFKNGKAPNGFDMKTMLADLALIKG